MVRAALQRGQIAPNEVGYIEAHGTGTFLGDPIEVAALAEVLCVDRTDPLYIGSVKTNIGHLEPAAGVAGLTKIVLALQHGMIPPHLHFDTPNPHIPWEAVPLHVPTELVPWQERRVAGVSSFGMSGTNVHVMLSDPPPVEAAAPREEAQPQLLTLSSKTAVILPTIAHNLANHLQQTPNLSLADICATLNNGRSRHHPHHPVRGVPDGVLSRLDRDHLHHPAAGGAGGGEHGYRH